MGPADSNQPGFFFARSFRQNRSWQATPVAASDGAHARLDLAVAGLDDALAVEGAVAKSTTAAIASAPAAEKEISAAVLACAPLLANCSQRGPLALSGGITVMWASSTLQVSLLASLMAPLRIQWAVPPARPPSKAPAATVQASGRCQARGRAPPSTG